MGGGGSSAVVLEWRKYEKSEYDGGLHLLAVDVDGYLAGVNRFRDQYQRKTRDAVK
jgi:hypothetical protein